MDDAGKIAYEAARNEILLRIRLREQILMFYLAAVGALLGVAFSKPNTFEILLIIPFIGLAVSFLFSQHTVAVASLAHFCRTELNEKFNKTPHWDNSTTLRSSSKKQLKLRSYGSAIIILIPCFSSLLINKKYLVEFSYPFSLFWWFSALCLVTAFFDIISSHDYRENIYSKNGWDVDDSAHNE